MTDQGNRGNRIGITAYRKAALVLAGGSALALAFEPARAADHDEAAAAGESVASSVAGPAGAMGAAAVELAASASAAASGDTAALAVAGAMADAAGDPITVVGERDQINSLNSRLGDIREAPQSISVIPREVIEQQAATTLRDVLRNVSGISMAAGEGGVPAGDNLTLRGFSARTDIFVDGIRDFGSYTRDTFNVEQVEVVKGPSSAQTGRGATGGYINLISKQPQRQTFLDGTAGIGTPEYWRATADINLAEDATGLAGTAFRLNLLYHDVDAPGRDHVDAQRWGIAPAVAIGLGGATRAILSYQYLGQDNLPDYGQPFVPATITVPELIPYRERPAPVDRDNFYGLLDRDYEETDTHVLTFALEHDLSDAVRLANVTRYGHSTRDSIISAPRFLNSTTTEIRANAQSRDTADELLLNQSNIFADFSTGGIKHELIAGFEIAREKSRNHGRTISEATTTDLFDPDPTRPYNGTIEPSGFTARAKADSIAGYLFDTITLSEQWLVSGGLRYDRFEVDFIGLPSNAEPNPAPLARTDNIWSWRAGVTFKPVESFNLYVGAGSSANPAFEGLTSTNTNAAVAALEPEKSRTYEAGFKWDGLDGRLLLTGAVFRIDKLNARTPGLPGEAATVLEGKQRVDGIELGATGRILPNWELIAAYTYLKSKIRESNTPAEVGNELLNTPPHTFSIWTTYDFPFGLEIGGGVRYVDERFTSNSNVRQVGSYWLTDATVAYDITDDITARINVFNLFDEEYIDAISGGHYIPGAARSAVATLAFSL
jgi:catecholate siderophore receptor